MSTGSILTRSQAKEREKPLIIWERAMWSMTAALWEYLHQIS